MMRDFTLIALPECTLVHTQDDGKSHPNDAIIVTRVDPSIYKRLRQRYSTVIISTCDEDEARRCTAKKGWCDAIMDVDSVKKKDGLHQHRTAFSDLTAKQCAKSGIALLISFANLRDAIWSCDIQTLSRAGQTLQLCKKFGAKVLIGSFAKTALEARSPHDMMAFLKIIRAHEVPVFSIKKN